MRTNAILLILGIATAAAAAFFILNESNSKENLRKEIISLIDIFERNDKKEKRQFLVDFMHPKDIANHQITDHSLQMFRNHGERTNLIKVFGYIKNKDPQRLVRKEGIEFIYYLAE